jgi:hypothetical protein
MTSKKTRRKEAERQKQAKNRRRRLWAAGLTLVLAAGIALIATTRFLSSRPEHQSKTPLTEPIQKKRKLIFNLMQHDTAKSTFCGLSKLLDETHPDIVFMEAANLPHEMAKESEAYFNGQTPSENLKFRGPISGLIDRLLSIIGKYRMRSGNETKLYAAESYNHSEIKNMHTVQNRFRNLTKQAIKAYSKGDIEKAITLMIEGRKALASNIKIRNDRVFQIIKSRIGEQGKSALLIIGAGHKNLIRMFEEDGFSTQSSGKLESVPLVTHFEAKERGWNSPHSDKRKIAARAIVTNRLSYYYYRNNFGEFGWAPVAEKAISRFSVDELTTLWNKTNSGLKIPVALRSMGYDVPTTQEEFAAVLLSLGYGKCD